MSTSGQRKSHKPAQEPFNDQSEPLVSVEGLMPPNLPRTPLRGSHPSRTFRICHRCGYSTVNAVRLFSVTTVITKLFVTSTPLRRPNQPPKQFQCISKDLHAALRKRVRPFGRFNSIPKVVGFHRSPLDESGNNLAVFDTPSLYPSIGLRVLCCPRGVYECYIECPTSAGDALQLMIVCKKTYFS